VWEQQLRARATLPAVAKNGTQFARSSFAMRYLYGSKPNAPRRLVATFSSEPQLRAYVRWATLESTGERAGKFEQGSVLASYRSWEASSEPLTDDDESAVENNPSPSML
jgi:hypothetical protein